MNYKEPSMRKARRISIRITQETEYFLQTTMRQRTLTAAVDLCIKTTRRLLEKHQARLAAQAQAAQQAKTPPQDVNG